VQPLKDATTLGEIEPDEDWPDMDDPDRYAHIAEQAAALGRENQHAMMATPWLLFPLEEFGPNVDIIKIGDDLGTQDSLLMSPSMYREMLAPIHADGDVFDLIPVLIEMGVDILNPIQTSAGRMSDLERLKAEYGGAVTFCGAIDTHQVLPHGKADDVREEVKRVIRLELYPLDGPQ
jgi:uroporphyrinogen decarboxylase